MTEKEIFQLVDEFEEAALEYGGMRYSQTSWSSYVAQGRKEFLEARKKLDAAIKRLIPSP